MTQRSMIRVLAVLLVLTACTVGGLGVIVLALQGAPSGVAGVTGAMATATLTTATTPAPRWHRLTSFFGNGAQETATFRLNGSWRLSWSCNPVDGVASYPLSVDLVASDGALLYQVARATCSASRQTGASDTLTLDQTQYNGAVRLAVRAQGSWMMIVEVYS